jgi:predicted RNA-binding protein
MQTMETRLINKDPKDMDLKEIIWALREKDPELENHLRKLLIMANKNKSMFDSLINMLKIFSL